MAPFKVCLLVSLTSAGVLLGASAAAQTPEDWRSAKGEGGADAAKLVLAQSYHGTRPGEGNALPRVEEIKGKDGNWVTWPGFMMRPDSGSRLFIQTTKALAYEKVVKKRSVRLEFKDTKVFLSNNQNPLVTVNFNTPLKTAYLKRHKKSATLVMELKVDAEVVITQATDADGYCYLFVDFPIGSFDTGGEWRPQFTAAAAQSSEIPDAVTSTGGVWEPTPVPEDAPAPDGTEGSGDAAPPDAQPPAKGAAPSRTGPAPVRSPSSVPQPSALPGTGGGDSEAQDPESEIFPST